MLIDIFSGNCFNPLYFCAFVFEETARPVTERRLVVQVLLKHQLNRHRETQYHPSVVTNNSLASISSCHLNQDMNQT